MLAGRITKARLYDRALSPEEVAASADSLPFVSTEDVLAAIGKPDRRTIAMHEKEIRATERQLKSLGPLPSATDKRAAWADLARAIFTFKEFIYIR